MNFSNICRHPLSVVACWNAFQNAGSFLTSMSLHQLSRLACSGLVLLCASFTGVVVVGHAWAVMTSSSCCMMVFWPVWSGGGGAGMSGGCFGMVCHARFCAHFVKIVS